MKNKITYALGCASLVSMIACGNPAVPKLGTQVDRMGRPAINTALTDPFALTPSSPGLTEDQTKDAYNSAPTAAATVTTFAPGIAANLAILDALDGTCGNQFGFSLKSSYAPVAGVLADDQLYVNSGSSTCGQYLAVEAAATGIIAAAAADCGGRTPLEDVIDTSYSTLAAGILSGVGDGISADGDGTSSLTAFPYLTAPN